MQIKPTLQSIISQIETYCNKHNLDHRFVGGVSFGGLLNAETTFKIDIDKRTISLKGHKPITLERSDHTIRDIDMISFSENSHEIKNFKTFIKDLKKQYESGSAKRKFRSGLQTRSGIGLSFPDVSIEAAIHTKFKTRRYLFQFVTAYEVIDNDLYLAFDTILQRISWESMEPWHVVLESGLTYTVRNPIADYYAYLFRSPAGIKEKDKKKLPYIKKLADAVIAQGKEHKPTINFMSKSYYGSWEEYLEKLRRAQNLSTKMKIFWMRWYWKTIGNFLSHRQIFSQFTTQFTGVRQ